MKKLMVAIAAAVVGVSAWAALPTGTSFEGLSSFSTALDDEGTGSGVKYWEYDEEADTEVALATEGVYEGVNRPAQFAGEANAQYLKLDGATLVRTVNGVGNEAQAIGDGLYFDSLVQIQGSEDAQELPADAKLAFWLKKVDAEGATPGQTNLVVTAGKYVGGVLQNVATSYDIDSDVTDEGWHRVTVKAINNVNGGEGDPIVGFVVFVDGEALTTTDTSAFDGITLTPTGAKWNAQGALFPSFVNSGAYKQKITSVTISGTGAIDDVSFTDVAPAFAADEKSFTLAWSDGVTGYTVKNGDDTIDDATDLDEAGSKVLTLPGDCTVITVTSTYGEGYYATALEADTGVTVQGNNFTITGDPASGKIVAKKENFNVGDAKFATFAEALTAAASTGDPIVLKADYVASTETEGDSFLGYTIDGEVTFDLAGNEISASDDDCPYGLFSIGEAGKLTLVSTGAAGAITCGTIVAEASDEKLFIGSTADTDFPISFNGSAGLDNGATIVKGWFDKESNDYDYLVECIDKDLYQIKDEGGYYKVVPVEKPTTYALTIADGIQNGKLETNPTAPAELEAETEVTVKATPNEGYSLEAITGADIVDGKFKMPAEAVELSATFTANVYQVTYTYAIKDELGAVVPTEDVTNANVTVYTYGVGATITAAGITFDTAKYESVTVDGEAQVVIGTDATGDKEIEVVLTKAAAKEDWDHPAVPITPTTKAQDAWPTLKGTLLADANAGKLQKWAQDNSVVFGGEVTESLVDAFLLNCDPTDAEAVKTAKEAFKVASIVKTDAGWEVKVVNDKGEGELIGQDGEYLNGYVNIISVKATKFPDAGDDANFFQAQLLVAPAVK